MKKLEVNSRFFMIQGNHTYIHMYLIKLVVDCLITLEVEFSQESVSSSLLSAWPNM